MTRGRIDNPIDTLREIKQKELEKMMAESIELEPDTTPWYKLTNYKGKRLKRANKCHRRAKKLTFWKAVKIMLFLAFVTWVLSLAMGLTYQYKRVKNQTYVANAKQEMCSDLNLSKYHSYAAKKFQLESCMRAYE